MKRRYKSVIKIVMTLEDCGNIEILNGLWYTKINPLRIKR